MVFVNSTFSEKALEDIERFQSQKVIDLRETLTAYCILQFKLSRKVRKLNILYFVL